MMGQAARLAQVTAAGKWGADPGASGRNGTLHVGAVRPSLTGFSHRLTLTPLLDRSSPPRRTRTASRFPLGPVGGADEGLLNHQRTESGDLEWSLDLCPVSHQSQGWASDTQPVLSKPAWALS